MGVGRRIVSKAACERSGRTVRPMGARCWHQPFDGGKRTVSKDLPASSRVTPSANPSVPSNKGLRPLPSQNFITVTLYRSPQARRGGHRLAKWMNTLSGSQSRPVLEPSRVVRILLQLLATNLVALQRNQSLSAFDTIEQSVVPHLTGVSSFINRILRYIAIAVSVRFRWQIFGGVVQHHKTT